MPPQYYVLSWNLTGSSPDNMFPQGRFETAIWPFSQQFSLKRKVGDWTESAEIFSSFGSSDGFWRRGWTITSLAAGSTTCSLKNTFTIIWIELHDTTWGTLTNQHGSKAWVTTLTIPMTVHFFRIKKLNPFLNNRVRPWCSCSYGIFTMATSSEQIWATLSNLCQE